MTNWDKDEQQRVVWSRLRELRTLANRTPSKQTERYHALRQEYQKTQVESSHEPLFRDTDQVLLTLAGIYLRFADHPEEDVKLDMVKRLEKQWKDCNQALFLLALILNPFQMLACFGPQSNLNQFKALNLLLYV